jgi:DNA polymerase III delta prime subunit
VCEFTPVTDDAMTEHLQRIATAEGLAPDAETLSAIAQRTRGIVRDAIQLLDVWAQVGSLPPVMDEGPVDQKGPLQQLKNRLGHKMTAGQFKAAAKLIDRAIALGSLEITYAKKALAKDADVAEGTVHDGVKWLIKNGIVTELEPDGKTRAARWRLHP